MATISFRCIAQFYLQKFNYTYPEKKISHRVANVLRRCVITFFEFLAKTQRSNAKRRKVFSVTLRYLGGFAGYSLRLCMKPIFQPFFKHLTLSLYVLLA